MRFLPDILIVVGLGCAAMGLWLIYPPAALILAGAGLCVIGLRFPNK